MQEYDRQQEDAAITKQEPQQKADADQAAMWESIGNVSPFTSGLKPSVLFLLCWLSSPTIQNAWLFEWLRCMEWDCH